MNARELWAGIETVVCDLDGVVYLGEEGVEGAGEALNALERDGIQVLFVTNNSTKTPAEAAEKIGRTVGYAASPDQVVTSSVVTARRLNGLATTALVVGADSIAEALAEQGITVTTDWQEADAVVVGLDREITYAKLSAATLAIRRGAAFYATNTDSTFPTPEGLLPGGGSIVAAIETASGTIPIVSGKPHETMTDHVRSLAAGPVLVVGDRTNTDIALAKGAGWRSALVLTGVVRALTEVPAAEAPDLVAASLAELVAARR